MEPSLSFGMCLVRIEKARRSVEKLRSDKIEDRREAVADLQRLGPWVTAELETLAKGPDAGLADLAADLLRLVKRRRLGSSEAQPET